MEKSCVKSPSGRQRKKIAKYTPEGFGAILAIFRRRRRSHRSPLTPEGKPCALSCADGDKLRKKPIGQTEKKMLNTPLRAWGNFSDF